MSIAQKQPAFGANGEGSVMMVRHVLTAAAVTVLLAAASDRVRADSGYTDVILTSPAYSVPEPGTLAMLVVGLIGLGGLVHRQHRRD